MRGAENHQSRAEGRGERAGFPHVVGVNVVGGCVGIRGQGARRSKSRPKPGHRSSGAFGTCGASTSRVEIEIFNQKITVDTAQTFAGGGPQTFGLRPPFGPRSFAVRLFSCFFSRGDRADGRIGLLSCLFSRLDRIGLFSCLFSRWDRIWLFMTMVFLGFFYATGVFLSFFYATGVFSGFRYA